MDQRNRETVSRDGDVAENEGDIKAHRAVSGVRAVERSLAILTSFTRERPERTLEGISESIKLPKSTTHRLLATLIAGGFVERGRLATTYRLGLRAAVVGSVAIRSRRPREEVHEALERLRAEVDETIGLSVLHGRSVVIVDRVESRHALRWDLGVGASIPAHCTSAGKALLSDLRDEEIEGLYGDERLVSRTGNSITTIASLISEVDGVRRRGYALDDEELAYGLRCIAVPVRGAGGRVEYALGVSGPAARLSKHRLLELNRPLQLAAQEITTHLSFEPSALAREA